MRFYDYDKNINYEDKINELHKYMSYRDMDKYIFHKNMHGTYSRRVLKGTKRLTKVDKLRITNLYNKTVIKKYVTSLIPARNYYRNINRVQIETLFHMNEFIANVKKIKKFNSEYYLIGSFKYVNSEMDFDFVNVNQDVGINTIKDGEPERYIYKGFSDFMNLKYALQEEITLLMQNDKRVSLAECGLYSVKRKRWLSFNTISKAKWDSMINYTD